MSIKQLLIKLNDSIRGHLVRKIVFILVVLTVLLSTAHVIDVRLSSKDLLTDYFTEQQKQKLDVVISNNLAGINRIDNYLMNISEISPEFSQAVEDADFDIIDNQLASGQRTLSYHGYILTDAEGEIKSSSYEGYDSNQEKAIASYVKYLLNGRNGNKTQYDIVNVLNQGPCFITGVILKNKSEEVVGVVVIASKCFRENSFMNYCNKLTQLYCSTYEGNVCVSTSLDEALLGIKIVGQSSIDPEATAEVNRSKKPLSKVDTTNGHLWSSYYYPIIDYKGDIVAIFHSGLDMSICEDLSNSLSDRAAIMSILISLVIILLAYVIFKRTLIKPVKLMCDSLNVMSHGDLANIIPNPNTGDEIQLLRDSMEATRLGIADTIKTIKVTAQNLHNYSAEMSNSSQQLSDGANQQAAALEEISSSLEEMTANIHQTTQNAQNTQALVTKADESINNVADEASTNREDSLKISDALAAINELVSQTNILSLNASVEAARAGEQGKGFAVVAKEVGRLADQTKDTASGISDTATKVIGGAEKINRKIEEVTPQIHEVSSLINEIAAASREQDLGAEQINQAISNLNHVTQNTAAKAEEIAADSQELAASSTQLDALVKKFKL